jgi:hypothetical protein
MSGILGEPIRQEVWYQIDEDIFTVNLTVYPGEIIAVSEKALRWLSGTDYDVDSPEGEWVLMKYHELEEYLHKLGFGKM